MKNRRLLVFLTLTTLFVLPACRKAKRNYTPLENDQMQSESGDRHTSSTAPITAESTAHAEAIRAATVNGAEANIEILPPADPDNPAPVPSYSYPQPTYSMDYVPEEAQEDEPQASEDNSEEVLNPYTEDGEIIDVPDY